MYPLDFGSNQLVGVRVWQLVVLSHESGTFAQASRCLRTLGSMGEPAAPGMQYAAVHGYSRALVDQVQAMLDQANRGKVAPNTALEDICQLLMAREKIVKE